MGGGVWGLGFVLGGFGGLKGRREHLSWLSFLVQGHSGGAGNDAGLLHEPLAMKRVQF